MRNLFIGDINRTNRLTRQIVSRIEVHFPGIIKYRRAGKDVIPVISKEDEEVFIIEAKKAGLKLRDLQVVERTSEGLAITNRELATIFHGIRNVIYDTALEVLALLKKDNPTIIETRISGTSYVNFVTDIELFKSLMKKKGIALKEEMQTEPAASIRITRAFLERSFIGNHPSLRRISKRVLDQIENESSGSVVSIRSSGKTVSTLNQNFQTRFFELMEQSGVKLKKHNP